MTNSDIWECQPVLTAAIAGNKPVIDPAGHHVIGVFPGEGIGEEIVPAALGLLDVLARHSSRSFEVHEGGLIGCRASAALGSSLPPDAVAFATKIFRDNGALFCGPGGDRFVYELRREFDMFCKLTPLEPLPELRTTGPLRPEIVAAAKIIAVRENCGGVYQGRWTTGRDNQGQTIASHDFEYTGTMVQRILKVAFALAVSRRKRLHLVLKTFGVPSISGLWKQLAREMAAGLGVELFEFEVDNAVYQLIANPAQFDVIVSPNMFGDVVADCGALLLASRGLSFSGNFNARGNGAFQTGHGAALDIAGHDIANPIGQMLALGMMLRESFNWPQADAAVRAAIRSTLQNGACTADIKMPGYRVLGTKAFANVVVKNLELVLEDHPL